MAKQDNSRLSKQERRELAREKARIMREEQEKRDKRNRMMLIGGIVGLVALVAIVVVAIVMNSNKSPYEGVAAPQGSTEGGFPVSQQLVAGQEGTGEVEVDIYLDYACSWCNIFEQQYADAIKEMASNGDAKFTFYPVALLDRSANFTGFSGLASNAAATVLEHAPDKFLDFNQQVFLTYGQNQAAMLPEIEQAAAAAGVPEDVIARFADGTYRDWVEATTRNFVQNVPATGTPAIFLDGEQWGFEQDDPWTAENALQNAIEARKG